MKSPGPRRSLRPAQRALILVLPALLIWTGFRIASLWVERRAEDPAASARLGAALEDSFTALLEAAAETARTALDASPWQAEEQGREGLFGGRLEGVGVMDAGGDYVGWQGMPVEPTAALALRSASAWIVRTDGVRTRLIARAGPNAFGSVGLATFVLDSTLGDLAFADLLAPLPAGARLDTRFLDSVHARPGVAFDVDADATGELVDFDVRFTTPDGELVALGRIDVLASARHARQVRRLGEAWGVVALVLAIAFTNRWRYVCRSWTGLIAAVGTVLLARGLLLVVDAPLRLLPRPIGSPSVYGSSGLQGLLGSPADLLLSAIGLYLLSLALRTGLGSVADRVPRIGALVALLAAGAATWVLHALTTSLAHHSTVPLTDLTALGGTGATLVLQVGWVLTLLGAAELWAAAWTLRGSTAAAPRRRPERRVVAAVSIPLALFGALTLQGVGDRLALERLRQELVPQVLDQSSYRRLALVSAVREAARALGDPASSVATRGAHPEYLAFSLWSTGDLYFSGYKSSIDVYDAEGQRLSHFGFDLPPLDDALFEDGDEDPHLEPWVAEEETSIGALPQRLLHAEMPVVQEGVVVGRIVGHVLDEFSNLPFLPASQPYLAALAPGGSAGRAGGERLKPGYVLYDRRGTVLLRTVDQPPTLTRELEMAATQQRTVALAAGDDTWVGLPLLDGDLLHMLLLRSRTLLERGSAFVRLSLFGLVCLLALFLLATAFRTAGLDRLSRALRGSFYRKLVVTLLLASLIPLVGLSLFVRGYLERRGNSTVQNTAVQYVSVAQRVVEDFLATGYEAGEEPAELTDDTLHWLRRLVEQEIHVYRDGRLVASSKRGLFDSGLLPLRLPGEVEERMVRGGLPYLVLPTRLGSATIPVAYAPLGAPGTAASLVVAVPMTLQPAEIGRAVERVGEVLLLATVALAGLLALSAAALARSVARPVRELVGATGRIAAGDYETRLEARTQDEVAELVEGFNAMASSLATQRADLEQRRDYMEALLNNATTGVVSTDAGGRIVTLNPAMGRVLGLGPAELGPGDLLSESLARNEDLRPLVDILERPDPAGEPHEIDLQRDGDARRFRVVRVDLPDPWGQPPGSLILMDDVTDLMRANRLAAWAEMARAIAHEIKNPLTPIQLSTEHLERVLRDRGVLPSGEIESCLDTVIKQVRALHEIATEFSTYAKLPALKPEPGDAVAFMQETIHPYRTSHPPGIDIEEDYREAPPVSIDRRVLGRAVINLVENALQAMPDGGTLTVGVAPDASNGSVVLTVRDTGTGLDEEVRARLFEPYFSTKSSGTGLGLAIVQRAVAAHHGRIDVESEAGRGTAIHIRLPSLAAGER
jgi:PAS domain S-box-containing protein